MFGCRPAADIRRIEQIGYDDLRIVQGPVSAYRFQWDRNVDASLDTA